MIHCPLICVFPVQSGVKIKVLTSLFLTTKDFFAVFYWFYCKLYKKLSELSVSIRRIITLTYIIYNFVMIFISHPRFLVKSPAEGRATSEKIICCFGFFLSQFDSWQERKIHVRLLKSNLNTGIRLYVEWSSRTLMTEEFTVLDLFCTGGGFVCDLTLLWWQHGSHANKADWQNVWLILCRAWWSLSSWSNDYLQWNKCLNKGAAGQVWYCSCLSRSKYVIRARPTFHHDSVSLSQPQHAHEKMLAKWHFTSKPVSLLAEKHPDDTSASIQHKSKY